MELIVPKFKIKVVSLMFKFWCDNFKDMIYIKVLQGFSDIFYIETIEFDIKIRLIKTYLERKILDSIGKTGHCSSTSYCESG